MKKITDDISEQMQRLYTAARELRGLKGKSAVANALNLSPQTLNHWEDGRPISSAGLLSAQEVIGCNAIWLRDGTGQMVPNASANLADMTEVARLVELYGQATEAGRRLILSFADSAEKAVISGRSANNKR